MHVDARLEVVSGQAVSIRKLPHADVRMRRQKVSLVAARRANGMIAVSLR
jgi:hypothetical protein